MMQFVDVAGDKMPSVGLGLWKLECNKTAESVYNAIKIGYRHIDSAADYGNEHKVGEGIAHALADGLCDREDLWITSKLWNTYHRKEHVTAACLRSLSDLRLDYLNLYLVHFPIALKYVDFSESYPPEWLYLSGESAPPVMETDAVPLSETWGAMESLVGLELVRHIGVCNYSSGLLHDLMSYAKIRPAMLQIESHPYLTQEPLIRTARSYGISLTAFSPLGSLSYESLDMATAEDSVLRESVVINAAQRLGVTPAQVVLRWGIQRGLSIIPKTSKISRLRENFSLAGFSLKEDEMSVISALNKNRRFNDPGIFCEEAFGRFHSIYD